MDNKNQDVKLALEEMRLSLQQSLSAGDALDRKVQFILIAAGLVLTLATALKITPSTIESGLRGFLFAAAIVSYLLCLVSALFSSVPRVYRLPIASEWAELDKQILQRTERDAILALVSGYVEQIEHNGVINGRKARLYKFSVGVLILSVLLIVSLAFTP